jgi:hypothetical protein
MNVEIRLEKVRKVLEKNLDDAIEEVISLKALYQGELIFSPHQDLLNAYNQLVLYKSLWVECLDATNVIDQASIQARENRIKEIF